ncbi:MAG: ABC transporter substrate-binding protein [Ilumatobacteraceae bacterium]
MFDRSIQVAVRRKTKVVIIGVLVALALAACGSDDKTTSTTAGAAATAPTSATADTFPVTITHKYGEAVIPEEPTKVISVGFNDQDAILALGVKPIAIRDWYGDQPFATWPWAQAALGDAQPTVLPADAINFEQIAALAPDLIVGISSGMTQDDYDKLSKIAPTIPQSADFVDYGVPWQVQTETIAKALGRSAQGEQLVADTEAKIAAAAAANPQFTGKTSAVAFFYNDQPGAYSSDDMRSRLMTGLGFVIPADIDKAADGAFYASFSAEQVGLLDVDALGVDRRRRRATAIVDSPLRLGLQAHTEGRELFVSGELAGAMSFSSPLSIPYTLEHLVPELVAAVDGDPATVVPSVAALDSASSTATTATATTTTG